jgi:hypothetical protein
MDLVLGSPSGQNSSAAAGGAAVDCGRAEGYLVRMSNDETNRVDAGGRRRLGAPRLDATRPKMSTKWAEYSRHIPEFRLFDTDAERSRVWRRVLWRAVFHPRTLAVSTCVSSVVVLVVMSLDWVLPAWLGPVSRNFVFITCSMIVGFLGILLSSGVLTPALHRSLRRELRKADIPVCLNCGYDLRGTAADRCSECGQRIESSSSRERHRGGSDPESGTDD